MSSRITVAQPDGTVINVEYGQAFSLSAPLAAGQSVVVREYRPPTLPANRNGTLATRFARALDDVGHSIRYGVDAFSTYDLPATVTRNRKARRVQAARERKC